VEVSRRAFLAAVGGSAAFSAASFIPDQRANAETGDLSTPTSHVSMLFGDAGAGELAVGRPEGDAYHSFRIPSLIAIPDRDRLSTVLIAVAEGRPNGVGDQTGDFDLLVRRSFDGGRSWSRPNPLAEGSGWSWTNPTLVWDDFRQELHCFMIRRGVTMSPVAQSDAPRVYLSTSTNRGRTWSVPAKQPHLDRAAFGSDCVGPGNGIQRPDGTLVVPARGRLFIKRPGQGWEQSDPLPRSLADRSVPYTEGAVALRPDGSLLLNYRASGSEHRDPRFYPNTRRILIGEPGAWEQQPDGQFWRQDITDPVSQASQIQHVVGGSLALLHLNSASSTSRFAMTMRASHDGGSTWPMLRPLADAPLANEGDRRGDLREGGYSSLASRGVGEIWALVEARRVPRDGATAEDLSDAPCAIVFRRFAPNWVLGA